MRGRVDRMTVAEWKRLRIKHPRGGPPAPATFLDDVLDEFPEIPMLIELKAKHRRDPFLEIVTDRRDRVILSSFDAKLAGFYLRSGFYVLQEEQGTSYPAIIDGVHAVGMDRGRLTPDVIDRIHRTGAKVWAWGDDRRRNDPRLPDKDLDRYMVNDPTKSRMRTRQDLRPLKRFRLYPGSAVGQPFGYHVGEPLRCVPVVIGHELLLPRSVFI